MIRKERGVKPMRLRQSGLGMGGIWNKGDKINRCPREEFMDIGGDSWGDEGGENARKRENMHHNVS